MKKKSTRNDVVVYNKSHVQTTALVANNVVEKREEPQAVVKKLEEPKAVARKMEETTVVQLNDMCGLDRAYDAANAIRILDNTLYIAGAMLG